MNQEHRRRLEQAGYKIGTVDEFLELTEAESKMVDLRVKEWIEREQEKAMNATVCAGLGFTFLKAQGTSVEFTVKVDARPAFEPGITLLASTDLIQQEGRMTVETARTLANLLNKAADLVEKGAANATT